MQNLIVLESRERNKGDVFLWIERNLQYPQKGDKIFILNSNSQNQLPYICCKQNTDTIIGMKLEKKRNNLIIWHLILNNGLGLI